MLLTLGLGLLGCNQESSLSDVPVDMGRAPLRRLNRDEFGNTMRDLLGTEGDVASLLPPDEEAYDFLTIADALTVSPEHVESWELAIEAALNEFFGPFEALYTIEAEGDWMVHGGGGRDGYDSWILNGSMTTSIELPFEGTHEIALTGYAYNGGQPGVRMYVDDQFVDDLVFFAPNRNFPQTETVRVNLSAETHTLRVEPLNGVAAFDRIDIRGPIDVEPDPGFAYGEVVFCRPEDDGESCVDDVLAAFLRRAWRHPSTADDVAWARRLYDFGFASSNGTFEHGLRNAFTGILLAPDFVYRHEVGPPEGQPLRPLDDFELASRLSYFLWSSTPDDALLEKAEAGELRDPAALRTEARRLLLDPRAEALVDTLTTQWFDIDRLESFSPDPFLYRDFDETLRDSMIEEMRALSGRFLRGEVDLFDLLTTREATIDARLAGHYRVPFSSPGWGTVDLYGTGRQGLLGTAGWLMAHSHQEGPSVVQRGKWVLGRLLCDSPPPPPPDIDQDIEFSPLVGSVREQEEAQRAGEPCHTCHTVMDPIGFSMGRFGATGGERSYDELGHRVDTSVELEGQPAEGLEDVSAWVSTDPRLPRCVVQQTFVFALGRPPAEADARNIDQITRAFMAGGGTFPALVDAFTTHSVFRHRADMSDDLGDLQ